MNCRSAVTTLAPAGLRVLIDRRLDRLSTNAKHVLNAAATLDDAITAALLVEICDLSAGALRESIEELLDSRFLNEHDWHVDHYEFQHAAVRNVVYVGMADDQRTRLHLRVAKVLEACDSRRESRHSAEIAHHYAAASPLSDPGKVADCARHAGDEAAASLSFAEAAAWYERVLRLLGRGRQAGLEQRCGRARARSGLRGRPTVLAGTDSVHERRGTCAREPRFGALCGPGSRRKWSVDIGPRRPS